MVTVLQHLQGTSIFQRKMFLFIFPWPCSQVTPSFTAALSAMWRWDLRVIGLENQSAMTFQENYSNAAGRQQLWWGWEHKLRFCGERCQRYGWQWPHYVLCAEHRESERNEAIGRKTRMISSWRSRWLASWRMLRCPAAVNKTSSRMQLFLLKDSS